MPDTAHISRPTYDDSARKTVHTARCARPTEKFSLSLMAMFYGVPVIGSIRLPRNSSSNSRNDTQPARSVGRNMTRQ